MENLIKKYQDQYRFPLEELSGFSEKLFKSHKDISVEIHHTVFATCKAKNLMLVYDIVNELSKSHVSCGFLYFQDDLNVEALDKLKNNHATNSEVIDIGEKLEDSLKKLHDTKHHHKPSEEKPAKVTNCISHYNFYQNLLV